MSPALKALCQWEYEPTLVVGIALSGHAGRGGSSETNVCFWSEDPFSGLLKAVTSCILVTEKSAVPSLLTTTDSPSVLYSASDNIILLGMLHCNSKFGFHLL
jgi:hypothetical protein